MIASLREFALGDDHHNRPSYHLAFDSDLCVLLPIARLPLSFSSCPVVSKLADFNGHHPYYARRHFTEH
jgi:hypothetical protein